MAINGNATPPGVALVALTGARKSFGAIRALDTVDLEICAGECLALVGHNGAGKSTLVNLINGTLEPSEGQVYYRQPDASRASGPAARRAGGVRAVYQELSLCPNLTVAENLRIPQRDLTGRGWRARGGARVMAALDRIFPGHRIRAEKVVGDLTLAERQMVEIGIGFADGTDRARLVILDEPTSSLDAAIAAQLLAHIARFCADGGAVIFISHMLGEVFEVATRIVVMRDGRIIADRAAPDFNRQTLVAAMGHVAAEVMARRAVPEGADILTTPGGLKARRGEIVGLAGLAGHGQAEALAAFYFSQTSDWRGGDPGAVFVAGDRARDGIFPLWSITLNATLAHLGRLTRFGLVDGAAEADLAQDWKTRIAIRTEDLNNPILSLSGGNQQKVLFARALATTAPVVVMDDPMRGVDIGTKTQVYDMIRTEAAAGRTFLWYSTETEETCLCDRVFVFRDGAIAAELVGTAITEENILAHSFEMGSAAANRNAATEGRA